MNWLRQITHLLPRARAWRLTAGTQLRKYFEGLSNAIGPDVKEFFDLIWEDIYPGTTRQLPEWEAHFGLRDGSLSETERRERLAATWSALGGQDPRYIQDSLQAAGFNVYIHEWWVPGTEPVVGVKSCATARNPLLYLRQATGLAPAMVDCGEAFAACGEAIAQCGEIFEPTGYVLVSGAKMTEPNYLATCGEAVAECGEELAVCGSFDVFREVSISYTIPNDPTLWPYFLYIGGATFGDLAQVDATRRTEFETLCRKITPAQQWLGMIVEYV